MRGQRFLDSYDKIISEPTKNITFIKKRVDSLLLAVERGKAFDQALKITYQFAIFSYRREQYDLAVSYATKQVFYYENNDLIDEKYSNALFNLAFFHRSNRNYAAAITNYNKVINLNGNLRLVGRSYSDIGLIYKNQDKYYEAIAYFENGINVLEKFEFHLQAYDSYINIAHVYDRIAETNINSEENYKKELLYIKKAIKLNEILNLPSNKLVSLYNTAANYYNTDDVFDFESAKLYYKNSLEIAEKNQDSSNITTINRNIGNLFYKQEKKSNTSQKDSIFHYLNIGLEFETLNNKEDISDIHRIFSSYSLLKKNFHKALEDNTIAFEKITEIKLGSLNAPSISDLEGLNNQFSTLTIIGERANIFLKIYETNCDQSKAAFALENLQVADELIGIIQKKSNQNLAKLFWRNQASYIYQKAVKACNILNDLDLAFYFTEKKKAFLITEGIFENDIKSQLPDSITSKERTLKQRIVALKLEEKKSNTDSLFQYTQELEKLTSSIKKTYPEYLSSTLKARVFSLEKVKEYLDSNTITISYVWSDNFDDNLENHYLILLSKNETAIYLIENTEELNNNINNFQTNISKPFENKNDQNSFLEVAHNLYNQLLPKHATTTIAGYTNLIIVPDGKLQNISFEALISSNKSSRHLIEDYRISYAYSLSFLMHNASLLRKSVKSFVGFAPVTFESDRLKTLRRSEQEISTIAEIVKGEIFVDKQATKQKFLKESQDANIIHLATHANSTSNPWIAFKDQKLNASELYIYHNQAELVTLSACSTTTGDIAPGEGVMSLARGFFHSGANTVVSSLWETNDKATSEIMISFYKHLKGGKSKSHALHQAKIDYISSSNLSQQSPYYWAPFILIGEGETVLFKDYYFEFFIGFATLLALLLIYFLKKHKK